MTDEFEDDGDEFFSSSGANYYKSLIGEAQQRGGNRMSKPACWIPTGSDVAAEKSKSGILDRTVIVECSHTGDLEMQKLINVLGLIVQKKLKDILESVEYDEGTRSMIPKKNIV